MKPYLTFDDEARTATVHNANNEFILTNVHPVAACESRVCVLHNPSEHNMRDFHMLYREDKGLMERICPHGIGHPDPDSLAYFNSVGLESMRVHGCDGCCSTE